MTKRIALLSLALAVGGCSGSDDGGGGGGGSVDLSAFSGYCTGTLLVDHDVLVASGSGSWSGSSLDDFSAPAGTQFLVSNSFDKWGGYIAYKDGSAAKVGADFSTGLILDQDFTSDCATDVNTQSVNVLISDSTFYPNADLTGEPCVLAAGTALTQFSFVNGNESAQVSSSEIQEQCGISQAYSDDIAYGDLIPE